MKKLIAIGEALIDFVPGEQGKRMEEVASFSPAVGGAPANVCGAFAKLGGEAQMITQLGNDPFGDKIFHEFKKNGIRTESVLRTEEANTSLAFVALEQNGDREFSFYRNPGADMLLSPESIKKEWFEDGYALHFCSVSLGNFPMKRAHERAISYAAEAGLLISFDPNLRPALWKSETAMKLAVEEFLPMADIVKISDDELGFIAGTTDVEEAAAILLQGRTRLFIYTQGPEGAMAFTKNAFAEAEGIRVDAVDTTGAGDAFIGSFLYQMYQDQVNADELENLESRQLERYLVRSNYYCSESVKKHGAVPSYGTQL